MSHTYSQGTPKRHFLSRPKSTQLVYGTSGVGWHDAQMRRGLCPSSPREVLASAKQGFKGHDPKVRWCLTLKLPLPFTFGRYLNRLGLVNRRAAKVLMMTKTHMLRRKQFAANMMTYKWAQVFKIVSCPFAGAIICRETLLYME